MRIALLLIMLCLVAPLGAADEDADGFLRNGVTAHRGNSGQHPECTLPAFASGINVGADWIELDILRTQDGKLVVIHDRMTGRVGDRNLDVMVGLIHKAGFKAGVWTVNSKADMKRFLQMGIDRIYTDYPTRLINLKGRLDPTRRK